MRARQYLRQQPHFDYHIGTTVPCLPLSWLHRILVLPQNYSPLGFQVVCPQVGGAFLKLYNLTRPLFAETQSNVRHPVR